MTTLRKLLIHVSGEESVIYALNEVRSQADMDGEAYDLQVFTKALMDAWELTHQQAMDCFYWITSQDS